MQVKSKKRVADHGEVYTNEREVKAMLDLVTDQAANPEKTFLEPACGNGNFLAEILRRKLATVSQKYQKSQAAFERTALIALGSLYGIELLTDNAEECRARLLQLFTEAYQNGFSPKLEVLRAAAYILSQNIICANALKMQTAEGKPIVFAQWQALNGSLIKRRDYAFLNLLDGSQHDTQLTLFSDNGEEAFIPEPVQDYPAVPYWEIGHV